MVRFKTILIVIIGSALLIVGSQALGVGIVKLILK
jgi:hypothetical protein